MFISKKHPTIGGQWTFLLLSPQFLVFVVVIVCFFLPLDSSPLKNPTYLGEDVWTFFHPHSTYALPKNDGLGGRKNHIEVFKKNGGSEALMETKANQGKTPKKIWWRWMAWWDDGMMCGWGWVVFFSCKLTLRLGRIAWIFCLNPEFGFGFTLLGTKKIIHIPPQDAFKFLFFPASPFWWETFTPEQCD